MTLNTVNGDVEGPKKDLVRWLKIHVGGKVLKLLVNNHGDLKDFMESFVKKIGIQTISSEKHEENIANLLPKGSVISLNHEMGNFADYIPFLNTLPAETLKNTYFFSIHQTSPMFQREFPEIADRCIAQNASPMENAKTFRAILKKVEAGNANIFMMPRGEVSNEEQGKLSPDSQKEIQLAKRTFEIIKKKLPDDTPWLEGNISFGEAKLPYGDIYKRAILGYTDKIPVEIDSDLKTISNK